ncbi:MAG: carbon-nitrogen hydrolase family protein [Solirubrobacterales bacterium]|nr:carbon-nitrogen hydrolase family protein [Solirubrobacterales bacterium]
MRVAAVQMCSTPDPDANLQRADALVRRAAADGAGLVLLPEKWTAYGAPEDIAAGAQLLDGPAITWARALAAELSIDLVAGSVAEAVPGQERTANTSVHVGPDGEIHATYRKLHLFDVTIDGRRYAESEREQPGEAMVLSHTADGVGLGLSVCYDLRFPELYRSLALAGARVLLVPAAFTWATTLQHWEVLLRARAIEEQCFVIAANQHSEAVPGLRTGGHSMVVDPWGVVIARAPADTDAVVLADLDLDRLEHVRATLPSLQHRRPEAYARPVEGT